MLYVCSTVGRKTEIGIVSFEDYPNPQVPGMITTPERKGNKCTNLTAKIFFPVSCW